MACYKERWILKLLDLGSQSRTFESPKKQTVEWLLLPANNKTQGKLPPLSKQILNKYVSSEIVKLSSADNSQVPIISFVSIKSRFQEINHREFKPLLYVRVSDKII